MLRRILALVGIILTVLSVNAQADLPPYIYYYDTLRAGLVIERADGSDSRFIDGLTLADLGVEPLTSPMDTPPAEFPSADGKYVGLVSYPPQIHVVDGGLDLTLFAHSASTGAPIRPEGYRWHEDNEWGFIDYGILLAGGGKWPIASVIFKADGTIQRELPIDGEAGFLPAEAMDYLNQGEANVGLKTASVVAAHEGYFSLVGWHPTEPDQLVTFSDEEGLTFWSLADGTLQVIDRQPFAAPYIEEYPIGPTLTWLPEQNRVALYRAGELVYYDAAANQTTPLTDVSYPSFTQTDKETIIRDALSGEEVTHPARISAGDFPRIWTTDQAGLLVLNGNTGDINLYIDTATGEITPLEGEMYALSGDSSQGLVALGSVYQPYIQFFNAEDGTLIDQFYGTAFSIALSPDGGRMATTSAGKLSIWDVTEYRNR